MERVGAQHTSRVEKSEKNTHARNSSRRKIVGCWQGEEENAGGRETEGHANGEGRPLERGWEGREEKALVGLCGCWWEPGLHRMT